MKVIAHLLLAVVLAAPGIVRAEEILLRVSLQDSIEDPLNQGLLDFEKGVEARTKGAVQVDIFDQSQFYNDYQVPHAVGSGAIEMGLAPIGQYEDDVPAAGVFLQPFLFNFDEIIRAAAEPGSEIRTIIDNEILANTGARVLWWQRYGSPVLVSKDAPIQMPDALANQNIRTYDSLTAEFINLCGGKPHVIADAKQTEAFDSKLIDANLTHISAIKAQELWRRTHFVTRIRLSEILYAVIINEQVWESLTEPQREIVTDEARKVEKTVWSRFAKIEAESYAFAREKGMTVQELTSDDIFAWRICSSTILESYMARAGRMGQELLTSYAKMRASPCCNKAANEDLSR